MLLQWFHVFAVENDLRKQNVENMKKIKKIEKIKKLMQAAHFWDQIARIRLLQANHSDIFEKINTKRLQRTYSFS